jgi:hypothetical protein
LGKRFYDGFVETYEYNEKGFLVSFTKYYEKTNKTWKDEYRYISEGQIDKGITYFNGEKRGYVTYKYDKSGNTIERKEYEDESNLQISEHRFEFDNEKSPYTLNFPMDMIRKNNIKKYYHCLIVMSYPPPQYDSIFEYNSAGLPVKETCMFPDGKKTVVYEYIYMTRQ